MDIRLVQHLSFFNPWSVLKCLSNNGALEPYWVNTSDNVLLKLLIGGASARIKSDLESLLQKKVVRHSLEESIIFPDLKTNDDLVWSFLLFSGYLTYTHFEVNADKKEWFLTIPNLEVKQMLSKLVIERSLNRFKGVKQVRYPKLSWKAMLMDFHDAPKLCNEQHGAI